MNAIGKFHPLRTFLRRPFLGMAALFGVAFTVAVFGVSTTARSASAGTITVYKGRWCGCCKEWVRHMEQAGFRVIQHDLDELVHIKQQFNVPRELHSCHTAVTDSYTFEGHVPADLVLKVLAEHPPILGLAVPGMPAGAPGMEGPNPQRYQVMAFSGDRVPIVYAER